MAKNRIKELRNKRNLTLDDVSTATKIKRGTLSNYELGKTEPKLETWQKLARFFDVSISYLQGLEMSHEELINQIIDILFDKYKEHDTYINEQKEQFTIYGTNSFHLLINEFLDTFEINLNSPSRTRFNEKYRFADALHEIINSVDLEFELKNHFKKFSRNDFLDDQLIIEIATKKLEQSISSKTKTNIFSIPGFKERLNHLQSLINHRNKLIKDKKWSEKDETNLIAEIRILKHVGNLVFDDLLKSL